ncbi:hypothetical protein [Budvicia aquatica]|nr:hypothetical protein [Budvicia aquatica]
MYQLLMSGSPRLCASLISNGFDAEPDDEKTKLYAISSDFETGFVRLKRFFSILKAPESDAVPRLIADMENAIRFLEEHTDRYLLLETIELDMMTEIEEAKLRARVETEIKSCLLVGAAVDALPENVNEAATLLKKATQQKCDATLDALYGLRFDDTCDYARVDHPLGVSEWSEILYFGLWNRAEFEANS